MEPAAQVVIGVDAHKRTHTLVAADELGRELATKTLAATTEGHLAAIAWAARWPSRRWAIEDCRHLTRTLEADLLRAGEQVVRVPTQMMAGVRRSARTRGKSDAIDALAIARAAWREPDLPVAQLDGPSRQVRLLVDHRDDLVAERTRLQSRIRWHLHEIAPELEIPARGLKLQHIVERIAARLASIDGLIAAICREQLDRVRELNRRINELEREIKPLVRVLAPTLLSIPGCGALTAAKLVGKTAGAQRFGSKSAYARWNGTAPQPASSGNTTRFRLNRGGNRQVNAALHRIALTQARAWPQGRDYIAKRIKQRNTKAEALRLLRRRLSDVVYRTLLIDELAAQPDLGIHTHKIRHRSELGSPGVGRRINHALLAPWLQACVKLPVGALFCVVNGPTRRRPWPAVAARSELRRVARDAGVRRRFAPHQLRHAHAVEIAREGVPLIVIQRRLGHTNLGITSIYLQGIDNTEFIDTVHARRAPTVR